MPFEIVRNDILNMQVDAIVNTANPDPVIGSGIDYAIYQKAGNELIRARKKIGVIETGDVAITPGFDLDCKYIIHAVGTSWGNGKHNEKAILASCYRKSLALAKEYNCESIAFPLMATGNYGFPKPVALQIAVQEISAFLMENEMQIYLVVFGKEEFKLSEKLFKSVNSYIDENYIEDAISDEYDIEDSRRGVHRLGTVPSSFIIRRNRSMIDDETDIDLCSSCCAPYEINPDDLGDLLDNLDAGFSETLLKLIDRTGKKDSEIYKKANVDRKLFSKIRNNMDYRPSKTTALAFAFALELDLEETKDFIERAGYALSHSNKFDVIIEYFLVNRNYDIFELNEVLFAFDQPLLGL